MTFLPKNATVFRLNSTVIPSKFKLYATSFAIALFRLLRLAKRGLQNLFQRLGGLLAPIGRALVRFFVLPIYRLTVTTRLKLNRLALPARGVVLFLITNRYLLHGTLAILALAVILTNVQGKQAHAQDIGQKSILFALATEQRTEIVEEEIRPESTAKSASYLGSATLSGIPHVDFDYDENADPVAPSISIPGTIAAAPYEIPSEASRAPRTKTETYLVQENDTIGSIAQHFGVNIGTVLWNNNLTERQYIRPGDKLVIPPVSGIIAKVKKGDTLAKIAARYGGDAKEILETNNLTPDTQLAVGLELVVPGGRPQEVEQTRNQIVYNTQPQGTPPSSKPIPKPADISTSALPSNRLLWPTPGHVITQYYGWKHTGVDIDGDYTSPLYASADGIVEKAGWNSGGYGLMILIDHPNGMKTRYAHASKLFVKVGESVKRGQVIAMMGTTGRSTGTHLHFEVYTANGKRTNPLAYTK